MSHQDAFICPSCGASLTARPDQTEVQCNFCGTTVIVPEALRAKPVTPPPITPAVPPPEVVVIEQQPTIVYQQGPFRGFRPRRRSGCGCCGCLGTLISLLALALIGAVALYALRPALFNQALSQAQAIAAGFSSTPQIVAFATSSSSVSDGGSVVVVWITNGENVRLERISSQGTQTLSSLPAAGEHTFSIANNETGQITFRLIAIKNKQQITKSINVVVQRR